MEPNFKKLNLDSATEQGNKSHKKGEKNFFLRRFKLILFVASMVIGFTFVYSLLNSTKTVFNYTLPKVFEQNAIKSTDGRVNVLLLGNGGGRHEGPNLTDSIIVASYDLKTHKVMLISIPRDLWVDATKTKINALYERGNLAKNGGDGLKFAKERIDDLVGLPIHYGVRVDFDGFAKAIDLVGGVDINVERTFDDYMYPTTGKEEDLCGYAEKEMDLTEEQIKALNLPPNQQTFKVGKNKVLVDMGGKIATDSANFACRFEHLHFDKGRTHLDGETALKYVRSRHAYGPEGSDFARSKRQQLVIQAFREKVFSVQTLINPGKIAGLLETFGKSVETDVPKDKYLEFYNLAKKVDSTQSIVLGDLGFGKSVLIIPPPADYGGAFVLTPPNDDFSIVQKFIKDQLVFQATASAEIKK